MYQDAFEAVCNAAKAKTDLFKKNPLGYFVSAMVAGMFIAFGAFISNAAAAPFADELHDLQCRTEYGTDGRSRSFYRKQLHPFIRSFCKEDEMERCCKDLGGMLYR